eukprot:9492254-Lingulodinium_polyedra.AAC.1
MVYKPCWGKGVGDVSRGGLHMRQSVNQSVNRSHSVRQSGRQSVSQSVSQIRDQSQTRVRPESDR